MNRLIASVFFISVSFTSGCSTSGNQHLKNETSQSLQSQITKNKTTKSEITALLGEPDTRTTLDNGNEEWTYFMNNNQFDPPHSSRSLDYWRVVHRHRQKDSKSNLKTKRSESGRSQKITARWKPVLFNNALYRLELFYENICNYYTHCLNFFTEWL